MYCFTVNPKLCKIETNLTDSKLSADFIHMHPEQKKSYQAMTPEQKLQLALDLYYSAKKLKVAGLQNQHPDWTVDTIRQKVRDIFLYART